METESGPGSEWELGAVLGVEGRKPRPLLRGTILEDPHSGWAHRPSQLRKLISYLVFLFVQQTFEVGPSQFYRWGN